ncbi:hypothetical protein R1flu_029289 [Riccia fluitans]|uniref:Uncharacterized protein n=1 Tax=Riccia fluitans TaxID=41844 RepID=A0ABD1XP66_9MARC
MNLGPSGDGFPKVLDNAYARSVEEVLQYFRVDSISRTERSPGSGASSCLWFKCLGTWSSKQSYLWKMALPS